MRQLKSNFHPRKLLVLFGLVLFGIGYNAMTEQAEKRGYSKGFLSFIVSLGCLGTLAGAAMENRKAVRWCLTCFVASGTPMILGSVNRYVQKRECERRKTVRVTREM